jgi:hypothetical protein
VHGGAGALEQPLLCGWGPDRNAEAPARTEPARVDIDTFRNPARRALASPADSWGWQVHPRHDRMENLAQSITQKRMSPRTENVFKDRRPVNTKTKS